MPPNSPLIARELAPQCPAAEKGFNPLLQQRFSSLRDALARDLNPLGIVENALVCEIARRGAQLESIDAAMVALELAASKPLSGVGLDTSEASVSIIGSPRYVGLSGLSMAAARSMQRALSLIKEYQESEVGRDAYLALPDARFAIEPRCVAYLVRRFQAGETCCANCGQSGAGYWISARLCWECRYCHTQSGVRHGTVATRSSLPLRVWFHAIRNLLLNPRIPVATLAEQIGIRRFQTVRTMAGNIRAATGQANASELLAGLDNLFLGT